MLRRMDTTYRVWVAAGALAGFLAVAAAAGGAHLAGGDSRALSSAVQMHGWHALALVGAGLWGARGGRLTHFAGAAFTAGLLLFCGTIYLSALGALRLGPLAPVGGTAFMLGWALLGISALRRPTALPPPAPPLSAPPASASPR